MENRNVPEKDLYQPAIKALYHTFQTKGVDVTFTVTADRIPDEILKYVTDEVLFLIDKRDFRPDIMGVVRSSPLGLGIILSEKLITVEVKNEEIGLGDWFQAKNYGDLYDAPIAMLISTEPIPEKLRRLLSKHSALTLRHNWNYRIIFARLNVGKEILTDFFPEDYERTLV